MQVHRTYQRKGQTTKSGYARLDDLLFASARLYNAAKEERKTAWEEEGRRVTYQDQTAVLPRLRRGDVPAGWERVAADNWCDIDVTVFRGVLRRVDLAYKSFFRRCKARKDVGAEGRKDAGEEAGYPHWKSGHRWETIALTEARPGYVKNGVVLVKGLPVIRLGGPPLPPSEDLVALKLTRTGRRLTVNLTYTVEVGPLPPSDSVVGIDMGVTERMAFSTGRGVPRRRVDAERIAALQRKVSSKRKGGKTRRKAVKVLANARRKEAVRNRNECHEITTAVVREHGYIAVEDLGISHMTRSARGTMEKPGVNVRAKAGLNREMQTQTWGLIKQQLRYKAETAGRTLAEVPPQYTSQTCSRCGSVDKNNRKGKRFRCTVCGFRADADHNAAMNILNKAQMAGGAESSFEG